jgi:hypothetical protein
MPHFGKSVLRWSWREPKYHEKQNILYEIAGFRREVGENCALLGYYKSLRRFGTNRLSRNFGRQLALHAT